MNYSLIFRNFEAAPLSDRMADALFALKLAIQFLAGDLASFVSTRFGIQNSRRLCRNSLHMHAGFEELESRRAFSPVHVEQLAGNSAHFMNAPSIPLRHETVSFRRAVPKGYDKWVTAEYSVQASAVKLWG